MEDIDETPPRRMKYDWQLLSGPEYTRGLRTREIVRQGFVPAWTAGIIAAGLLVTSIVHSAGNHETSPAQMSAIDRMLYTDPATFVSLPGGERVSYKLQWLADLLPSATGMGTDQFAALIRASAIDVAQYGPVTDKYAEITKYETAFGITDDESIKHTTRPAKVFTPKNIPALATSGVIAIPENQYQPAYVFQVAAVNGKFTLAAVGRQIGCMVLLGDGIENCPKQPGDVSEILEQFKPVTTTAQQGGK